MKPLKKKLTTTEYLILQMKEKYNYMKFLRSSAFERRKQKNINTPKRNLFN